MYAYSIQHLTIYKLCVGLTLFPSTCFHMHNAISTAQPIQHIYTLARNNFWLSEEKKEKKTPTSYTNESSPRKRYNNIDVKFFLAPAKTSVTIIFGIASSRCPPLLHTRALPRVVNTGGGRASTAIVDSSGSAIRRFAGSRHSVSLRWPVRYVFLFRCWSRPWPSSRCPPPSWPTGGRSSRTPTTNTGATGPSRTRTCTSLRRPLTTWWPAKTCRLQQVGVYTLLNTGALMVGQINGTSASYDAYISGIWSFGVTFY